MLLESRVEVLWIVPHIPLEVLYEVYHGEERLVVVHLVTNAVGRVGVDSATDNDTPIVTIDYELDSGVGFVTERDVATFVDTSGHLRGEVGGNVANLQIGKVVFHRAIISSAAFSAALLTE